MLHATYMLRGKKWSRQKAAYGGGYESEIRSEDRQAALVDTLAADEDKDKVDEGGRCVE